jgi:predicted nucleic acid-binding protein
MTFSSCLTEEDRQLVLDASVVINLLATGAPAPILRALGIPVQVTDNVVQEVSRGDNNGDPELASLDELIASETVRVSRLEGSSLEMFAELVSGSTVETLGDGEAATLAFAHAARASAAIDERKATRIASIRFRSLRLATTIDILANHAVVSEIGKEGLARATFQALRVARMHVREHQFEWVAGTIGHENVANCPSLRRLASSRPQPNREKLKG